MATSPREPRRPLSRARVLEVAVDLADRSGLEALSMRKLGEALGVEAMSLYGHVASKDDLLDGMVDAVFAEVDLPSADEGWRPAMRRRADSVRAVLRRHRWAIGLMESRTSPGPATLAHHDAVIGVLRAGGFTVSQTAHAFSLLDSYVYGFALQEKSLPFQDAAEAAEVAREMFARIPLDRYPHFVELATQHALQPGYDHGAEFAFGLELVLDGLERLLSSPGR
ncbi:TetR/AcrR family transcriptional regulator [Blastococcus sp. SYSU D00695]